MANNNPRVDSAVDMKHELKSLRRINRTLSGLVREKNALVESLSKINNIKNNQLDILRAAIVKGDPSSIPLMRERIMSLKATLKSIPQIEQSVILKNAAARSGDLKYSTRLRLLCRLVSNSGYFDKLYYLENNLDVLKSGQDPLRHFVQHGGVEGRSPGEGFDSQYYLYTNSDVREAKVNPLIHYLLWGRLEGRYASAVDQQKDISEDSQVAEYYESKNRLRKHIKDLLELKVTRSDDYRKLVKGFDSVVLYPLSYPIEITQRPQHILKSLGIATNKTCIILDFLNIDAEGYFTKLDKNLYITNRIPESINYFQKKGSELYITYPFYSFLVSMLRPKKVLYDVIDDLSCFSGSIEGLRKDHGFLLKDASIVTYSSKALMELDADVSIQKKKLLLENGVWVNDFAISESSQNYNLREHKDEYVLGYYGAISNLLDWSLLERITGIDKIRLVMIGPIVDFENGPGDVTDTRNRVLSSNSVTYVESAPYEQLPHYSYYFDASIVPFVINDITDAVSPLKMFEYMAAGHEIFATRTKTILEYEGIVSAMTSDEIIREITSRISLPIVDKEYYRARYESVLKRVDWLLNTRRAALKLEQASNRTALNIDIANVNFYDWNGEVLYKGGAERYVFDLAKAIQGMGHTPRILQNAYEGFEKKYKGIDVIGVVSGDNTIRGLSKKYKEICSNADLVITSPLDLSCELGAIPSIGISHGIHWDSNLNRIYTHRTEKHKEVFDALIQMQRGVCVDTNFINWTRTYDYELAGKLKFIPNYYDARDFKPTPKDFKGRLTFVYPRRLYEARGITITLEVFDELLSKYKDISLLLVGQTNDPQMKNKIKQIMRRHPDQINLEEYPMEEMPIAYTKGQVVLVPTLYAEGTSLSCIEAMATNNVVITTNIGGLSNLIIDRHNGILIEPTANELKQAVEEVIADRKLAETLATNARTMVRVFEKNNWDRKWRNVLLDIIKG